DEDGITIGCEFQEFWNRLTATPPLVPNQAEKISDVSSLALSTQDHAPSEGDREKKLATVIGKKLYNCYGASFNELEVPEPADEDQSPRVGRPTKNLSLLTPLEVAEVFSKYGELSHVYTVVLSLKRPDGRRFGIVGHMRQT